MQRLATATFIALIVLTTAPAQAGLWQDVYRGLEIATIPAGNTGGNRFGRLAIVQNEVGEGYRLELDRRFGVDSLGRPEVYDFGNYELEMSGALQASMSYTTKGLLTANAEILMNSLSYEFRGETGVQDLSLSGTLNMDSDLQINELGFYTLNVDIQNNPSELLVDGLIADFPDGLPTDYEIGPISVEGNIYADLAIGLLSALGVDTTSLEEIFPQSGISRVNDEIDSLLQKQADALDLIADASYSADGTSDLTLASDGTVESVTDADSGLDTPVNTVPEPISLLALGMGTLVLIAARRRM